MIPYIGNSKISCSCPITFDEIEEFYRTYKNLENKKYAKVREWKGRDAAFAIIDACIAYFKEKFGDVATIDPLGEEEV